MAKLNASHPVNPAQAQSIILDHALLPELIHGVPPSEATTTQPGQSGRLIFHFLNLHRKMTPDIKINPSQTRACRRLPYFDIETKNKVRLCDALGLDFLLRFFSR